MPEFRSYTTFEEFVIFNQDFIESNPFLYFHLQNTIGRVFTGSVPLYKFFNIIEDEYIISVLMIENECLIYANQITDKMIELLSDKLEFHKFNRYNFLGTKQVIDGLFSMNNVFYSELKHRKYYECSSVTKGFEYPQGEMEVANIKNLSRLIKFNEDFIKEFYDGEKSPDGAKDKIINGIEEESLFQWTVKSQVSGIAQVISESQDFSIIGHVYTPPEFRGRGIASSIVHKLTKKLLNSGQKKCMLMTNAYNPASNRAFIKAGYVEVGEYVVRFKEK